MVRKREVEFQGVVKRDCTRLSAFVSKKEPPPLQGRTIRLPEREAVLD